MYNFIQNELEKTDNLLSFYKFMNILLYHKEIGYYMSEAPKIGRKGDFITAPELSSFFSFSIAHQCIEIFKSFSLNSEKNILELGGGNGLMAAHILLYLEKEKSLPSTYFLIDLSPHLQKVQLDTIKLLCPHLISKVSFLSEFPPEFEGIILANEVLDAMPIHLFKKMNGMFYEIFISKDKKTDLYFNPSEIKSSLFQESLFFLEERLGEFPDGYQSEINLNLSAWLMNISTHFKKGVFLVIDYGYGEKEYYHPERVNGTLSCYYKHNVHFNPLIHLGQQDISAHVDFSKVVTSATQAGLDFIGYTNQASFLFNNNLLSFIPSSDINPSDRIKILGEVHQLSSPSEMGTLIKVMGLSKNMGDISLEGFKGKDFSYQL